MEKPVFAATAVNQCVTIDEKFTDSTAYLPGKRAVA
jgi:hypothetical protein